MSKGRWVKTTIGPAKPFQGEIMICVGCRRQQKSDPEVESGWTAISVDGAKLEYHCPQCWSYLLDSQVRG